MKKLLTLLSVLVLAFASMNANAQELGKATIAYPNGGKYMANLFQVILNWDGKDVDMTNPSVNEYGETYIPVLGKMAGHDFVAQMVYNLYFNYETNEWVVSGSDLCIVLTDATMTGGGDFLYGDLVITIPTGCVKDSTGATNEEQVIEYVLMEADWNCTILPENYGGYTARELSDVSISFNGNLTLVTPAQNIRVLPNDGEEYVLDSGNVKVEGNAIRLNLSSLEEGTCKIIIPEGYVLIDENGNNYINYHVELIYTIWNGLPEATVLSPVYNFDTLSTPLEITWDYAVVSPAESGLVAKLVAVGKEIIEEDIPVTALSLITVGEDANAGDDMSGNVMRIDLSCYADRMDTDYTFLITIPANVVNSEIGPNPEQVIVKFFYAPFNAGDAQFSLTDGVVSATWTNSLGVGNPSGPDIYIEGEDKDKILLSWYSYLDNPDGEIRSTYDHLEIDLNTLELTPGDYELILPAGAVSVYTLDNVGYANKATEFKFSYDGKNFSGVQTIETDDESRVSRMYDVMGREIVNPQPGTVYIKDGRKYIAR